MKVYLDESGDLGFNFRKPFRKGGSSRYLTIAFLLVPKDLSPLPKRIVKSLYRRKKRSPQNELKGGQLTVDEEVFFAGKTVKLLSKYPHVKVLAITVNKRKVKAHIRQDPNKLYNVIIQIRGDAPGNPSRSFTICESCLTISSFYPGQRIT